MKKRKFLNNLMIKDDKKKRKTKIIMNLAFIISPDVVPQYTYSSFSFITRQLISRFIFPIFTSIPYIFRSSKSIRHNFKVLSPAVIKLVLQTLVRAIIVIFPNDSFPMEVPVNVCKYYY